MFGREGERNDVVFFVRIVVVFGSFGIGIIRFEFSVVLCV